MPLDPKTQKIYTTLKGGGADVGTEDEFKNYFYAQGKKGYENRKKVFDTLKGGGADAGKNYEEFRDWLGLKAVTPQRKQQASSMIGGKGYGDGSMVKRKPATAVEMLEQNKTPQFEASYDVKDATGNVAGKRKVNDDIKMIANRTLEPMKQQFVDAKGNVVKEQEVYPLENPELSYERALKQSVEASDLERQSRERLAEIEREENELKKKRTFGDSFFMQALANMSTNPSASTATPGATQSRYDAYKTYKENRNPELDVLAARKKLAEDRIKLIEDAKKDMGIFTEGNTLAEKAYNVGRGLLRAREKTQDVLFNGSNWDFGASDTNTQMAILDAATKFGNGEELSDSEKKLLDDWALSTAVNSHYGSQLSGWTKAAMVTGESAPFMIEMAINPASGLGQAAQKGMIKMGMKKFGKELIEKQAKSILSKRLMTKAMGLTGRLGGDFLGANIMAATTGAARVASDTARRMTGEAKIGEGYKFEGTENGETLGDALSKAFKAQAIEYGSEMAGEYFGFVNNAIGKIIGKSVIGKEGRKMLAATGGIDGVPLGKAQKFIYDLTANKGVGAFSKGLDQFLKKTKWNGVIGEYAEEVLGNIANAATVGDKDFSTKENGVFNLEENIDTFCGVALMGGFMSALNTAGYVGHKINYNPERISNNLSESIDNWGYVKTSIDNAAGDPREINDLLTDMMSSNDYTKEQKKGIMKYTASVLEQRGREMADFKPRVEDVKTDKNGSAYTVSTFDKNGKVIEENTFNSQEDADAYKAQVKMQQQKRDFEDYLDMSGRLNYRETNSLIDEFLNERGYNEADESTQAEMLQAINDTKTDLGREFRDFKNLKSMEKAQSARDAIRQFEEENGWEEGSVMYLAEQDPMTMNGDLLAMADQAREFLKGLAYPNTEVHTEISEREGSETAEEVLDGVMSTTEPIDPMNNPGKEVVDSWDAARKERNELFEKDENLKEEVEQMEAEGFSPQEIISSLDTFSDSQKQVLIDYYNAKAKYDSYMLTAENKINEAAAQGRKSRTFTGTIDGQEDKENLLQVTDGTNVYTMIGGDVTTKDGAITGSDSGIVLALDENGDIVTLSDKNLTVSTGMTLDEWEAQEVERLQGEVTMVSDPEGKLMEEQGGNNADVEAGGENTGADEASATAPSGTALERIPKDEQGNPIYEQGTPEDTYDALTEQVGDSAQILIKNQLDAAKKRHDKLVKEKEAGKLKGKTVQEQVAEIKELQDKIDAEDALVKFWTKVMTVPNNRRADEEVQKPVEEVPQTGETINETNEEGAPDWSVDKASDARARGYRMENGYRVDRQQPITEKVEGNDTEVKFDKAEEPIKGKITVVESGSLIPSHVNGQRNVMFFIDEAQPKERTDVDSEASSNRIAEKVNPEEITGGVTAYTGSPVVNSRGEVIQGNNRTIGMQKMWNNAAYEESQKKYKQYLIDHADEFGLDASQIEKMNNPVMVRMVDVADDEAIRLGQKTAANTESGGKERIDPQRVIQQMGDNFRVFTNQLFSGEIEDQTLLSIIAENGVKVLKWLNDGTNHPKYITDTQFQSCFDNKGNLTEEAKTDLRRIVENMLFRDAPERLSDMFYKMPAKAQNAILSTLWRDSQSEESEKIIKDIQSSIEAFTVINGASEEFRGAKDVNTARAAVKDLQKQTQMFGDTETVLEKFSNFALELAIRYKGDKQNNIRSYFNNYYDAVQGKGGSLFESAAKKAKEQAIKDIFDIDINENENGTEGSNTVESDTGNGTEREPVSEGEPAVGEPVEEGEQPAVSGGGTETNEEVAETEDEKFRNGYERRKEEIKEGLHKRNYDSLSDEGIQNSIDERERLLEQDWREQPRDNRTTPEMLGAARADLEFELEELKKEQERRTKEEKPFELTLEALEASDLDESVKSGARAWLNGDKTQANQLAFLAAQDYVRSIYGDTERGGSDADSTQLGSEDNVVANGEAGRGNGESGLVDSADNGEGVPEVGTGGTDSTGDVASSDGTRSDSGVSGEAPEQDAGSDSDGAVGSSGNRRKGRNGKSGRKAGGTTIPGGDAGRQTVASAREELDAALKEFEDALKESITEPLKGKLLAVDPISLYTFLGGAKAIKVLNAGTKVAYAAIKLGYYEFKDWVGLMKSKLGDPLRNIAGMSEEQIDGFIEMMWDYSLTIDGVTRKVSEWASVISSEALREQMSKTIEEKRELQKEAEKIPTIIGDITNIRESLPFLLTKQQEDVQKAETQFFDESHADAKHGHGKGYMFTNGTGTGKTYTGLGIVKRFLKQGKGRILIVTASETKINDWIKDAKNLGISASMLPDTSSKGKGVVVTQYANIRQNRKLLEDEFDLIVYDESHKIMENQDGSATSTSRAHHMLSNRDIRQAARRVLMAGDFGKEIEDAEKELELLKQAVSLPTTEWTKEVKDAYEKAGGNMDSVEERMGELREKTEKLEDTIEEKVNELLSDTDQAAKLREAVGKTKVVFLSATPFNVPANLDYTEGYIFSYTNNDEVTKETDRLKQRDNFLVENFNSSHSRNAKTQVVSRIAQERIPDPQKASEEEVKFSDMLQSDLETMSGRDLDSEFDYSREFPKMDFEMADMFNDAIQSLSDGRFNPLRDYFDHLLDDYNTMTGYLEIFKAQMIAPRIREYIDLGKKVTLYHRRKASNTDMYPPFFLAMQKAERAAVEDDKLQEAIMAFRTVFKKLFAWEQSIDYMFPQDSILREFMTDKEKETYEKGLKEWFAQNKEKLEKLQAEVLVLNLKVENLDGKELTDTLAQIKEKNKEIEKLMKNRPKPKSAVVSVFNGSETAKDRSEAIRKFNDDNSSTKVLVVQVQAGKEGISLHDTTGEYPRVQIGIFLPQSPIEFIQTEGRIFRVGNKSNAIFEYPLLGLDIELGNFAQKINGRSETTENLALGSRGRGLKDSISRAALASRKIDPNTATGIGGKELDNRKAQNADGFDEAMKNYSEWREEPKPSDINQIEVPDPIGYIMTKMSRAENGERVLIPNARRGSIARYMPSSTRLTAMEERNKEYARLSALIGGSGRKILNEPFVDHNRVNKYDLVVLNTSHGENGKKDLYGNSTSLDTRDVLKACNHTDPSGRVVALVDSDKVGEIKEAIKKSTSCAPVMEVKLPSFVLDKPSSILILDNIEDRDKRNAVKAQELDLSQARDEDNLFAQLRDMVVPERNIDKMGRVERKLRTVITPFVNTGCMAKSKNYSTGKMESDVSCRFGSLYAHFARGKMAWMKANGRVFNAFVLRYNRIVDNDIDYIQEIANDWVKINDQLELDDEVLYSVYQYYIGYKRDRLGSVRDCLRIMAQSIELALGKTPMQIRNIAEGKVENEVSGVYDLKGFREVFDSLNNDDAELEALADKVFDAVGHIEGLKFQVLPGAAFRSGGGHNVVAHFVPSRNIIELNGNPFNSVRIKDSFKAQTVVHEMIHALTSWAIETYNNEATRGQLSQEQQEACKTIKDVFAQINNDDFRRQLRLESNIEDNAEYGLTDEHEMMAELANPIFRKVLKAKKLWKQLINGIKMLLGIQIPGTEAEETDALTALDEALETLMNTYDPNLYSSFIRNSEAVRNMEMMNPSDPMQSINDAADSWRGRRFDEDVDEYTDEEQRIIEEAKKNGTYMKAPNGKKSNLSPKQWVQVRTKNFISWFGDWEIASLYNQAKRAWNENNSKSKFVFAPTERVAKRMKDLLGHEVTQLVITDDAIRHIKKNHGSKEAQRGQIDITPEDIATIPYLINNFDTMVLDSKHDDVMGNRAIEIRKRINGTSVIATIERGKNKEFVVTAFTMKKSNALDATEVTPGPNVRNDFDATKVKKEIETIKENAKNSSKIVDENGEPLVVYHGSVRNFEEFKKGKVGSTTGDTSGFYFTNSEKVAKEYYSKETGSFIGNLQLLLGLGNYNSTVYPCFLKSNKPFKADSKTFPKREIVCKNAKDSGYDSVLYGDVVDGPRVRQDVFIVFEPNQIKSATDNNGGFSNKNPNIRFDEDVDTTVSQHTGYKQRISNHIDALAEKLGTRARTTVYHLLSEVPEGLRQYIEEAHKRGRRVRGWYENGQIYLFLPDINSTYEAEKTIWHETVAHHGLRQLVGDENLDKLLRQLWLTHKDGAMGKWVTERMTRNGWALNEAIEEYLAREAEKNPFKEPTLWQRVRWMLADILHSMGFASDPTISDVQYLFWLSQNRLNDNDPLGSIKRQAFLYRLERAARESAGNNQYVNLNAERVEDIYNPEAQDAYDDGRRHSEETDEEVIERLDREPKIKAYRAMQLIDGKLYPPMAAKQGGKLVNPIELGKWEKADEHPEMADENGKFKLDKGNGKSLKAAYNPYIHTSTTMLNDQFSEAQSRPNLVVVEVEVPESELTSGYKAGKAKDSVGRLEWKAGPIQGQLTGTREVILSRWDKPVRIVPAEEVAKHIYDMIKGQVDVMPTNVVTPQQREELEKLGVQFVETDNRGFLKEGENAGKSYSSVYGKKAGRRFDEDIDDPVAHSARAVYEDRLNRAETVFSEAYQDSMISLKAGQNAIAKDKDIPDSQNAYMAENLMHGKNKNEQDLFNLMFRDPLIKTINKIMDLTGMTWGDVDRYVYTKSGLERNREFYVRDWLEANKDTEGIDEIRDKWLALKEKAADIDESYTFADYLDELTDFIKKNINSKYDPSKHDYSGFRAMFGEDYDESEIIDDLMNTEAEIGDDVNTLWEQINACTKYGLDRYKEAGLKSEEQIENVKKMFHWYVPMRGFKEDTGEDMYQYFTGKGKTKNYVGGLLRHAKGRGSEASYPISTIFAMTYKAISDCNQNLVNQKFYRLCQAHKNDLVVLSDSWVKLNEDTGEWEEVWPEITDDMDEEDIRKATIDFEKEMNRLADDDKASKIKGKPNFVYKPIDKNKKSEHVVEVWMNGQKRLATVVGNPRMAQALNGQLRFERGHNIFSKWNADIKNFMASLFTSYSPTFALRNMLRDWTHFRTMLIVREGEGYAHAAGKYYAQQMPKMMSLFKKYREGTLGDSEMERDFKDFMDNGGITGFVQMNKIDEIQKEMEKLHKQMKDGKVIKLNNKLWDISLGAVEAFNEAIENNARFATYRASRHYANRTKARSAYDAKEITVNFNRKGAGSKTAGFKGSNRVEHAAQLAGITSQILGEGRIFFNATVQAIATTFKNFQNPDGSLNKPYIAKWAAKYAAPPFLFGLALPFINQMLAATLGGDDDDPYANLPEWTRRKNLCIYAGNWEGHDYFITIPVGQELAAFLSLGDMFAGYTYAPNLKPVDRSFTEDMAGVMNTFSPIDVDTKITKGGLTRDPLSEITGRTFSVLAPLVAVEQNLSWTGRPIYREDLYQNDYLKPEYQMVYSGTNPVLVGASKILHELGGGDDITRGSMEVNPAIVQYLWEQYTGGPGKVFSNTISIGKDVKDIFQGKDSEFNIRKVEGLKAFVQQGDDRTEYYRVKAKYRKYKEDADKLYNDIKGYKSLASEDPTAKMKLDRLMQGEEYARMKIAREAEKHLAKMRKSADSLEGAEKKKRMKEYNKLLKEVVDRLDDVQ